MDINKIKIPTILAVAVLVGGLVSATFLVNQNQIFKTQASITSSPKNVQVTNISGQSATLIWQTDSPSTGFIQTISPTQNIFADERDTAEPQKHLLHSVKLNNLTPNTTYHYKINSAGSFFEDEAFTFSTSSMIEKSNNSPIIGSIVDDKLQPISEALIVLTLPGSQSLSAISKISGSFILPLSELKSEDLSENYDLGVSTEGSLKIYNTKKESSLTLLLPVQKPLSVPIVLGQNQNLIPQPTPTPNPLLKLDLNKDGILNSLDLSIIIKNQGLTNFQKETDLNNDGKVNQQDTDLFKSQSATVN